MEVHRCTEECSEDNSQPCMVYHPPTILSPTKQLRAIYGDQTFPDIFRQDEGHSSFVPNGCGCIPTTQFTCCGFIYFLNALLMD